MINAERTSPIIYRYLGSHWYETLRDAEFLASSPNKFNDLFDCSALATGSVPDGEVEKYLTEHDWISVFSKISREKGFPIVDTTLNILNSGYINRDTLNIDERLKNSLKNRTPLSKAWRIVCFSESPTNSAERLRTEKRMWNRYSDKNRGVRIGVDFSRCSREINSGILGKVVYSDNGAVVNLDNALLEPKIILNYSAIVLTKKKAWERENEIRLITTPKFCRVGLDSRAGDELCFWSFNREIVREVCLGTRFPKNQIKGLVKMIRRLYPKDVNIFQAKKPTLTGGYQYDVL